MFARFIVSQFRKPTGLIGRYVGGMMAKQNVYESRWTVSLLDVQPEDHLLEIGFGPGVAVQFAAEQADRGMVAGVDLSETMVQAARKRNASAVSAGRVDLRCGESSSLPYPDASFDKVFSIHCIYFWPQPVECLKEIKRVLKPGGLLGITILPKDKWLKERRTPPDFFTLYDSSDIVDLFSKAGFQNRRVEKCAQTNQFPGECILGYSL